jgi:sec-independent protein translocase protein TatA
MGLDNPLHIAFLVVILLLVFGARRLPEIGRSLGSGMREFKDSITGESKQPTLPQATQPTQAPPAQPPVTQAPVAAPVTTQAPVAAPAAPVQPEAPAQAPAEPTHQA